MPIIIATSSLFVISLVAVWGGVVPPFTEDTARAVNVSKPVFVSIYLLRNAYYLSTI